MISKPFNDQRYCIIKAKKKSHIKPGANTQKKSRFDSGFIYGNCFTLLFHYRAIKRPVLISSIILLSVYLNPAFKRFEFSLNGLIVAGCFVIVLRL
jgi:hypothetical protein